MTMAGTETHGYIQLPDRALHACLHAPNSAPDSSGIVLVPPFGEERKCAYRLLTRLARRACENGFAVLRFDLSGTGESTGDHASVDVDRWVVDIEAARDTLLASTGVSAWSVVGARFGANLAARLGPTKLPQRLVLVEPLLSGEDYLRDLKRRQLIKTAVGGTQSDTSSEEAMEEAWGTGQTVDFGGFPIGPAFHDALAGLDLASDLAQLPQDIRVSLLRVTGAKKLPPSWQPLADALSSRPKSSVRIVRDKPFWGQLDYYESDAVIDAVLESVAEVASLPPGQENAAEGAARSASAGKTTQDSNAP